MALSASELSQVQYFLGYGNMTTAVVFYFDVATIFGDVIQNNIDAWGEGFIRNTILVNLNQLETDIFTSRSRAQADRLEGEITLNKNEMDELLKRREFFISRLEAVVMLKRKPALTGGGRGRWGEGAGGDVY